MRILVLNCGSSSLKFTCFDLPAEDRVLSGSVDRLDTPRPVVSCSDPDHAAGPIEGSTHADAVGWVAALLARRSDGRLDGIGHRVVHGGERFPDAVRITDDILAGIGDLSELAPLHNPIHLEGIRAAADLFPDVPQAAVFDTAFHQTLPEYAYRYAIPDACYTDHRIRRYGFHGTSHRYVSERAAALLGKDTFTGVTCHLGNGSSLAAIDGGRSVDTSMGLTPLGGIPMGTRSGDLDPAVVLHLQERLDCGTEEMSALLNRESGLLGLSGRSNDLREVEAAATEGDERSKLAIDVLVYSVARTAGGYLSVLPGADGIVFTGGIGENAAEFRSRVIQKLSGLPVEIDTAANAADTTGERIVSTPASALTVFVIPTDEELVIARDTRRVIA